MRDSGFFDDRAETWEENNPVSPEALDRVLGYCQLEPGQDVLDVGTGTGRLLPLLLGGVGREGRVDAIDPSAGMLSVARKRHRAANLQFRLAAAEDLPYKDERFDRVVCYAVFPHFENRQAALRELRRVLRPAGLLIIAHTKGRSQLNRLHHDAGEPVRNDRLPPAAEVASMLHDAGLEVQDILDQEDFYALVASKHSKNR